MSDLRPGDAVEVLFLTTAPLVSWCPPDTAAPVKIIRVWLPAMVVARHPGCTEVRLIDGTHRIVMDVRPLDGEQRIRRIEPSRALHEGEDG